MKHPTIKRFVIDAAGNGDNTLLPAKPGVKYVILSFRFICASAVTVTWKSGSTAISGGEQYPAMGGAVNPDTDNGWMETAKGEAFVMNLSSGVSVDGQGTYAEVVLP